MKKGEIHSIIGENGAGKSTLMKILYGMTPYDSGEIYFDGRKIRFASPREAVDAGIGMIHQEFMLIPSIYNLGKCNLRRRTGQTVLEPFKSMKPEHVSGLGGRIRFRHKHK